MQVRAPYSEPLHATLVFAALWRAREAQFAERLRALAGQMGRSEAAVPAWASPGDDIQWPLSDTAALPAPRNRAFLERLQRASSHCLARGEFAIAELARAVGLSERQLQRRLRASLNTCPRTYLRDLRLQKAAQLLNEGHAPGDVAIHTGFSSHSHFGACFKERFKVTPGEYVARRAGCERVAHSLLQQTSDPAAQGVLDP